MKRQRFVTTCGLVVGALLLFGLVATSVQAQEISVSTRGGVEIVSIPQASPGEGLCATKLELRAAEGSKLVTFDSLAITGDVVQVFDSILESAPSGTWNPDQVAGTALYNAAWADTVCVANLNDGEIATPDQLGQCSWELRVFRPSRSATKSSLGELVRPES